MEPAVIARDPTPDEKRVNRLERLRGVCHVVSGALDLDPILSFVCDAVRDGFGFDRVAVYHIDSRSQRIVGPLAVSHAPGRGEDGAIPGAWELRRGATVAADVALGQTPYSLCNEPARDPTTGMWPGLDAEGPRAVVPLCSRGQIVGLMLAANPVSGHRLSDGDVEELRPFAEQAGLAIARASFAAESQRRVGFLSALLQISTSLTSHSELTELLQGACDKLLEVAEFDLAAVFLVQERGQTMRLHTSAGLRPTLPEFYAPFRLGERLAGRAALERLVIVNRNIQQDDSPAAAMARRIGMRTVVSAPLLLRGELLGVLGAATFRDLELTGEETDLVASVANQLSAAIANVRLIEETRRQMEEHRRGRDELDVLYSISRAMAATIGIEERLRVIAGGFTEATHTTRCVIFRRDRNSLLPWISYGDTVEEKRRFQALDISAVDATRLLRAVSAQKPPVVMREIDQAPYAHVPWLREWGVRSALWLPLVFQNRVTGLAMVYQPGEERGFTEGQVALAAALAHQAAIAIRVSLAYEHERNVAAALQLSITPTVGVRLKNFDLGQAYHPALREAQVGGDFYDVFHLPDGRVALLMADVSGKGLPAAMQTAMVKYMLRAYAVEDPAPASVLRRLNQGVCAFIDPDLFVTAFYAVLCPQIGQLQYGNAGHDSPLLALKEHGYCTSLDVTGPALGLDPTVTYFTRSLCLAPGDLLLLYTDGITNAARNGELFGRERLEELLAKLADGKPSRIVSQIYRSVRAFAAGNLQDDCALLAVKAKEDGASSI